MSWQELVSIVPLGQAAVEVVVAERVAVVVADTAECVWVG